MSKDVKSTCSQPLLISQQNTDSDYKKVIAERDEERQFFEAALPSKILAYEANLTKNSFSLRDNNIFFLPSDANNYVYDHFLASNLANILHPLDKARYSQFSKRESLILAAEEAKSIVFDDFRFFQTEKKEYVWVRKTIVLIKSKVTGDVKIRCFIDNISELSIQSTHIEPHKRISTMTELSIFCYEINLTKNIILWEQNHKDNFFDNSLPYDKAVTEIMSKFIAKDDVEAFGEKFTKESLQKAYDTHSLIISLEHRIELENQKEIWVLTKAKLYAEVNSNDIMCILTVEDIHENKIKEIYLTYQSQHDTLSDLFNKDTTEKLIDQYLTAEGKEKKHAFFLLDIDDFKNVNDTFGHAFGDSIIEHTAKKLKTIFRKQDIIGRIGGDEFVAFMTDFDDICEIRHKAEEVVALLKDSYVQSGKPIDITISIGVALYSDNGSNFRELYINSDTAMYNAKKNGKNMFCLFSDSFGKRTSQYKAIDKLTPEEIQNAEESISEYVFRILYSSNNRKEAINKVLKAIGHHFKVSRNYIFEIDENKNTLTNTFEWVKDGVKPQIDNLQGFELSDYLDSFQDGVFYLYDVNSLSDPNIKEVLTSQGIKSMLQIALYQEKRIVGFVGYDQCEFNRIPTAKELAELKSVANMLGAFISEMRAYQKLSTNRNLFLSLLEQQDTYNVVIDDKTLRVLAISNKIKESNWTISLDKCCHDALLGKKERCENCPLEQMRLDYNGQVIGIVDMNKWNEKAQVIYSWIDWEDNTKKILLTIKIIK